MTFGAASSVDKFFAVGIEKTDEIIRDRVGDMPLYITFDRDALDQADAPRPPIWELCHEGLRASQIAKNFQGLRRIDIIGGDIVCIILAKTSSTTSPT